MGYYPTEVEEDKLTKKEKSYLFDLGRMAMMNIDRRNNAAIDKKLGRTGDTKWDYDYKELYTDYVDTRLDLMAEVQIEHIFGFTKEKALLSIIGMLTDKEYHDKINHEGQVEFNKKMWTLACDIYLSEKEQIMDKEEFKDILEKCWLYLK